METIRDYLANMFNALPKTAEMTRLKNEMQFNMETRYQELKAAGKNENEAVGTVIAEFGNIEELMEEMGIAPSAANARRVVSLEEAREILVAAKKHAWLSSIGGALILFGVALMFLVSLRINGQMGGMALLIMMIPAVGLLIYSGYQQEPYRWLEAGDFALAPNAKDELAAPAKAASMAQAIATITGVGLILFGVAALFAVSYARDLASYGVCLLMCFIGAAVFCFIRFSLVPNHYKMLMGNWKYTPKHDHKAIGIVASIVWPLAVCTHLIWGFMGGGWNISWIVYPIVGILFGAFSAVYSMMTEKNDR